MNKGFFITMDAAIGLLVVVLIVSTSITLIQLSHNQASSLQLERQARDLYEYNYSGGSAPVPWIKTACTNSLNKVSIDSFVYNSTTVSIKKIVTTVCN